MTSTQGAASLVFLPKSPVLNLLLLCCCQVAANTKGIQLVQELIAEHSLQVVQAYMRFIQANAGAGNAAHV
jgi:hypothetical protein